MKAQALNLAVRNSSEPFSDSEGEVGIVISRMPEGHFHTGFCYKWQGGVEYVHLGWEDRLFTDWSWDFYWVTPNLEEERLHQLKFVAKQVVRRFSQSQEFPYAILFGGSSFDVSGHLHLGERAQGLTCATFVLALFKSLDLHLVDELSWPMRRDEDLEWVESLVDWCHPALYEILKEEVLSGVRRIRPIELLAAAESTSLPVKFECIEERSLVLEEQIT